MKQNFRTAMLACGSALAAVAVPALAQTSTAPAQADETAAQPERQADIIVTANKREERIQEVPISLSVIPGDQLTQQNVNAVSDLTRSTPALNTAGPFGALSIRGIGSVSFSRSSEGSVGVVVDNVALAGTSTNPPQLFDVARVEVLEGPQGTLFGRNASAGVVNIITNAPDPTRVEAIAHADVGSRNNYIGNVVFNLPVANNAALRVGGAFDQEPETQFNRNDGSWLRQRNYSGRARFKWDPTSDITINLIGDYSDNDTSGGVPWSVYYSTPGSLLSQRLEACGVNVGPNNQQGCTDGGNRSWIESYGFSTEADMKIGSQTLTSISAYRAVEQKVPAYDVDSVPVDRLNQTGPSNTHNFSQEIRLTSPSHGLIEYVAGLYYFDGEFDGSVQQAGPLLADLPASLCPFVAYGLPAALCQLPIGQTLTTHAMTTSTAVFGQATVNLTNRLRLILGARYGHEDVYARTVGELIPGALTSVIQPLPNVSARATDSYFSYRVGAQYDLTPDVMVYGTYTRGYKGPAINDQAAGPGIPAIVRPEIPKSGEIGLKATLFGGRVAASLAGYYTKVTDFQAQFFDATAAAFVFGNAPSLTSKGVTFNLFGRPFDNLSLNLGAAYDDARYGKGYVVACSQLETETEGCEPIVESGVVVGTGDDAGGNRLVGAPEWKVTASGEYDVDLSNSMQGYVQADMVYTSRLYDDAAYNPIAQIAPAAIFGGRIGVRFDKRFGIAVFARNLFDVYRPTVRLATPAAAQQLDPQSYSQISGPESRRVIGVSLDGRF